MIKKQDVNFSIVCVQAASAKMYNLTEVPSVGLLFEPFLLVVFIVGFISNTLLLVLICKTCKVINSTSIYLFSVGGAYLLTSICAMCLIVTLASRTWILGYFICSVNQLLFRLTINLTRVVYLVIAHDRYKAVVHPLSYYRVKKRNAMTKTLILWIIAISLSLPGTMWSIIKISETPHLSWTSCFGEITADYSDEVPSIILDVFNMLISIVFMSITLVYYGFILKELHTLSLHRSRYRMMSSTTISINSRDRPIFCSAEERAAKSLITITFSQFACDLATGLLLIVRLILFLKTGMENETIVLLYILTLFFHMLPIVNPALLIAINKRFCNRLKGLLKCEILPENNTEHEICSHETPRLKTSNSDKKLVSAIFITKNPVFLEEKLDTNKLPSSNENLLIESSL